jgi:nucleoside-diphosphate-sugar epimerase
MSHDKLNVITGATGLLGSHIAGELVARGERVRGLVRSSSDTSYLREIGVELCSVDLHDPKALAAALAGASVVYHCAARVGDWGPWSDYQRDTVDVTRRVAEACRTRSVGRLLHVSSISVYGKPRSSGGLITEDARLGQHMMWWDHYARSKILAEAEARQYPGHTIVRPSWIYGPRDRTTIPRVVRALRSGKVPFIGSGENLLNLIYAGDVAQGAILAANHSAALGRVYNLASEGEVTQKVLVDTLTDILGLPRIRKHVPFFLAYRVAFIQESFARLLGRQKPPRITRRAIYLIGRSTLFSSARARSELGWQPRVSIQEGARRALDWYLAQQPAG